MNKKNITPGQIPSLDSNTANEVLNNIYMSCGSPPNMVSVEVLEREANYLKSRAQAGRMITYALLIVLVLLPVLFFRPSVRVERTNVDYTANATYEIWTKSFLPVKSVSASINGSSVSVIRSETDCYLVDISENGTLEVNVTSFNGQTSTLEHEVTYIDTVKPELVRSYSREGIVYLIVRDTYSGIDFDNLSAAGADSQEYEADSIDREEGIVSYIIPASPMTVSIPDHAGNTLKLLVSPVEN